MFNLAQWIRNATAQQRGAVVTLLVMLVGAGWVYSSTPSGSPQDYLHYDSQIDKSRNFQSLDENLFGEKVNLQDGATTFEQTDISIKTGSPLLNLEFGRMSETETTAPGFGAGWGMNVPYMVGQYDSRDGWNVEGYGTQRCSAGTFQPKANPYLNVQTGQNYGTPVPAFWYWRGVEINLPNVGHDYLLKKNSTQPMPANGKTYYGTTRSDWRVGCLGTIQNGAGEGFTVLTTDGTTYYFDWIATYDSTDYYQNNWIGQIGPPLQFPLKRYYLFATKVVDRFGNTLTYSYSPAQPSKLVSISSSDGNKISVTYAGDVVTSASVGNRTWRYAYDKTDPEQVDIGLDRQEYVLRAVTLPDLSKWQFGNAQEIFLTYEAELSVEGGNYFFGPSDITPNPNGPDYCTAGPHKLSDPDSYPLTATASFTMVHPSGAIGEFTFHSTWHGINNAPGNCDNSGYYTSPYITGVPAYHRTKSISKKRIYGPGLVDRVWTFGYQTSWSYAGQCTFGGCDSTEKTTATRPDGSVSTYSFGNDYATNFGQQLSVAVYSGGVKLRQQDASYITSAAGQAFPDNFGDISVGNGTWDPYPQMYGNPFLNKRRPATAASTIQDGEIFSWQVPLGCNGSGAYCFDAYARPLKEIRSSTLGYSKTDTTTYFDSLNLWTLGQVATRATDGIESDRKTYAVATALPITTFAFGKLQKTFGYYADGNLQSVKDGNNNVTVLSSWKRGVPQLIAFPDSFTLSATVDNNGWITSVTDENGFSSSYGYDPMGRLASVIYPQEDNGAGGTAKVWNDAISTAAQVNAVEYGIPAGHWKQTVRTGNGIQNTYFDAMWRPLVEESYDGSSAATQVATTRIVVKRYDSAGRAAFVSYPVNALSANGYSDTSLLGTDTFYDALDRTTRIDQDSELGVLHTYMTYLAGLKTQITNPRGFKTTASYKAFDTPSTDLPVEIDSAVGTSVESRVTIGRDAFGKPGIITRHDVAGATSESRTYTYDQYQQLCLTSEPETGVTVMDYDAANSLLWTAGGQTMQAGGCTGNRAAVGLANRTTRTYDVRNRVKSIRFPDARGDQDWTYYPDGLPNQVTSYDKNPLNQSVPSVVAYHYNHRRMLDGQGESIVQPGWYTWSAGHGYDANGHLSVQTYPDGFQVAFAPNALGQPTKAGTFASGVTYFPNGAIKQFTYGNGIVHTLVENARQLPDTSCDSYGVCGSNSVLNVAYDYDANGNVAAISDGRLGHRSDRDLGYDALDRLTSAQSMMFGNTGAPATINYAYDVLDNLIRVTVPATSRYAARDQSYCYDTHWQLVSLKNGSCVGGTTVTSLTYDVQGNLLTKGAQAYGFGKNNRLFQATGKESYYYDAYGRRFMSWDNSGGILLFDYDSSGQLLYYGGNRGNGTDFVYLQGSLVATRERDATGAFIIKYQHTDALGTPVAVTDVNRIMLEQSEYEPYGQLLNRPVADAPGFTGHEQDALTGLTYMQQRYYDPQIGRFLSTDPVLANADTGDNFTRYGYANNNPYRFTDPDGRQSVGEMIDSGSEGCGSVSCAGWAVLSATWRVLGAEGFSQVLDKGDGATTGDRVHASLELASVLPPVKILRTAETLARGGAEMVRIGQAGEASVRALADIGPKVSISVNGATRIPDGLTATTLSEVKNVASLSYTRQLRDFAQFAKDTGREFNLYVRSGAKLSAPLRRAEADGFLNIIEFDTVEIGAK